MLSETCIKCAECCKNFPFVELSGKEISALGRLTGLAFDIFSHKKREAVEEYFLKFKENGDCFFLTKNGGSYSCSVYEARSEACRRYPSSPRQHQVCDANREMIRIKSD